MTTSSKKTHLAIAIASGKGGVGKSTICAQLALAMVRSKLKVGLLDADIYGPSQADFFNFGNRDVKGEGDKILPPEVSGIRLVSMAMFTNSENGVLWRGPMVEKSIAQLFDNVAWGDLDVLLIDLPPGTGEAQLAVVEKAKLDGVVIISTAHELANIDVIRGLEFFRERKTPVLGLVDNMSSYLCPNCGEETQFFSSANQAEAFSKLDIDLLASIPLMAAIQQNTIEDAEQNAAKDTTKGIHLRFDKLSELILTRANAVNDKSANKAND